MKTHLFVLLPATTAACELEDAFNKILQPYYLDQSLDEVQPNWQWDYLCLFDSTLNCDQTEAELPEEVREFYQGRISKVSRLRPEARTAGSLVTPDGVWHDVWSFGYSYNEKQTAEANRQALENWNAYFSKLLQENTDCWVIEIWAHS